MSCCCVLRGCMGALRQPAGLRCCLGGRHGAAVLWLQRPISRQDAAADFLRQLRASCICCAALMGWHLACSANITRHAMNSMSRCLAKLDIDRGLYAAQKYKFNFSITTMSATVVFAYRRCLPANRRPGCYDRIAKAWLIPATSSVVLPASARQPALQVLQSSMQPHHGCSPAAASCHAG